MLFTGQFEMTEYAITGVFDTDDFDLGNKQLEHLIEIY